MRAYNINADCFVPSMPLPNAEIVKPVIKTSKRSVKKQGSDENKYHTQYKTELCKNWIEVGYCRYSKQCKFAHGYGDLKSTVKTSHTKDKNCK